MPPPEVILPQTAAFCVLILSSKADQVGKSRPLLVVTLVGMAIANADLVSHLQLLSLPAS